MTDGPPNPTLPPAAPAAAHAAARSLSAIAFNQIAQVVGSVIFVVLVPRALDTEVYGQLAYTFALTAILQTLGELGYQEIFSRFLPEVRRSQGEAGVRAMVRGLFGARVWIGLALGVAAMGVALLVARWLTPGQGVLIGLAVLARIWSMGPYPLLLGLGETLKWSVETTWRQVVVTGLVLLLVRTPSLTLALVAMALHEAIFLALGVWWTRGYWPGRAASGAALEPQHRTAALMRYGFKFSLSNFSLVLLFRISPITVEALTGSHPETGYFDLALGALLLLYTLLGQVAYAFVPILTQLHLEHKPDEARMWLGRVVRYGAMLLMLGLGGMWAVATPLTPVLFGASFAPAAETIRMMALGLLPLPIAWAGVMLSAVEKRPARKLWAALTGLVVFAVAAGLLRGGASAGIALAFALALLGYALGFGRGALEAMRTGGAGWVAATLGALVFGPLFLWRQPNIVLGLAVWAGLALAYIALMLVTRAAQVGEVQSVLAVVRRRGR